MLLQAVSSFTSYPDETLQVDLVEPTKSPVHRHVMTVADVLTINNFTIPSSKVRADTIERELTSIFF